MKRPPLGIIPRYIWDEKRLSELSAAIVRYLEAGYEIHPDWIEEYDELIERLSLSKKFL